MKKIYKLCLGAGASVTGITPVIATVSCGCSQAGEEKKTNVILPNPIPAGEQDGTNDVDNENSEDGGDEVVDNKPTEEVTINKPTEEVTVNKPTEEVVVNKPAGEVTVNKPTEGVVVNKPAGEVTVNKPTGEVTVNKHTENVASEQRERMISDSIDAFTARLRKEGAIESADTTPVLIRKLNTLEGRVSRIYTNKIIIFFTKKNRLSLEESKGLLYLMLLWRQIKNNEKVTANKFSNDVFDLVEKRTKLLVDNNLIEKSFNVFKHKVTNDAIEWSQIDLSAAVELIGDILIHLPYDMRIEEVKLISSIVPELGNAVMFADETGALDNVFEIKMLNSIGHLLKDLINKGIGGIDFTSLRKIVDEIEKMLKPDAADDKSKNMWYAIWKSLKVPSIVVELERMVRLGIFGVSQNTVDFLNHLSNVAPSLKMVFKDFDKYAPLLRRISSLTRKVISDRGISSTTKQDFEGFFGELHKLKIPTPDIDMIALMTNILYDGWKTQEAFSKSMKSLIDEDILSKSIPLIGTVDELLTGLFHSMYNGTTSTGSRVLNLLSIFDEKSAQDISKAIQKGLFNLKEQEYKDAIDAIVRLIGKTGSIMSKIGIAVDVRGPFNDIVKFINELPKELINSLRDASHKLLFKDIRLARDKIGRTMHWLASILKSKFGGDGKLLSAALLTLINGIDDIPLEEGIALSEEVAHTFIRNTRRYFDKSSERDNAYLEILEKFVKNILIGKDRIEMLKVENSQSASNLQSANEIYG